MMLTLRRLEDIWGGIVRTDVQPVYVDASVREEPMMRR